MGSRRHTWYGYADDIAIRVEDRDILRAAQVAEVEVRDVIEALGTRGLTVEAAKTEMQVFSHHRRLPGVSVNVQDVEVRPSQAVRWLGYIHDRRLNPRVHVDYRIGTSSMPSQRPRYQQAEQHR